MYFFRALRSKDFKGKVVKKVTTNLGKDLKFKFEDGTKLEVRAVVDYDGIPVMGVFESETE